MSAAVNATLGPAVAPNSRRNFGHVARMTNPRLSAHVPMLVRESHIHHDMQPRRGAPFEPFILVHSMRGMGSRSQPAMSGAIIQVVRHAKQEAARHGSLFVNPEHLLLGLLLTPCAARTVLHEYRVEFNTARTMFDSKVAVPVSSMLEPTDVDLSPHCRDLIMYARECAQELGSGVVGTAHLAAVLTTSHDSPLRSMLEAFQANVREAESKVLGTWEASPEEAGAVVPLAQQVERLREEYKRMVANNLQGDCQPQVHDETYD